MRSRAVSASTAPFTSSSDDQRRPWTDLFLSTPHPVLATMLTEPRIIEDLRTLSN